MAGGKERTMSRSMRIPVYWDKEHGVFVARFANAACIVDSGSSQILIPSPECLGCEEAPPRSRRKGNAEHPVAESVAFGTETFGLAQSELLSVGGIHMRVWPIVRATGPGLGILGIGKFTPLRGGLSLNSKMFTWEPSRRIRKGMRLCDASSHLRVRLRLRYDSALHDVDLIFDSGCTVCYSNCVRKPLKRLVAPREALDLRITPTEYVGTQLAEIYGNSPFIIVGGLAMRECGVGLQWDGTRLTARNDASCTIL